MPRAKECTGGTLFTSEGWMGLAAGSVVLATKHESFHLDVVDNDDDFDVSVFASTMETVCPHFNTAKQVRAA